MKDLIVLLIPILSLSLLTTSCSKDGDGVILDDRDRSSYFECELNGKKFSAKGISAYATSFTNSINIYGANALEATEVIYIELPQNFTEGTHRFNEPVFGYYVVGNVAYSTLLERGHSDMASFCVYERL